MKHYRFITAPLFFLLLSILPTSASTPAVSSHPQENLNPLSLADLKARAASIDAELEQLAQYSLRNEVGAIGYRSDVYPDPNRTEWVQINLEEDTPIDQIVLVPAIWRSIKAGFETDGFPIRFQVIAGSTNRSETIVLARFSEENRLLPRIAPILIPCSVTASWVRVEAFLLSPRQFDQQYNLELAEIMIFNGRENLALHQPVTISSSGSMDEGARKRSFLVDGFVPYLMNAGRGDPSIPFLGVTGKGNHPSILIDLESELPVNRIHLHTMDFNDTTPQATPAGYGLPRWLRVEGGLQPDFSDAALLFEYRIESIYETGPIIIRRFPETACRYIRFTALEPYIFEEEPKRLSRMGFAEIEIFSRGVNAALHKSASGHLLDSPGRSFLSLTDGNNLYGKILPVRQWMEELARRHDLETRRPRIAAELDRRYALQKINLRRLGWLTALLAAGILFTVLIGRMRLMRKMNDLRERFAADLHDELGANLNTIGLLSDLSEEMMDSPEKLSDLLARIRVFTDRSGAAVRYCSNMMESKGLCEDLPGEMKQSSARLLGDLEYTLTVSGEEWLQGLPPRKRSDLFLFYKECLINILRHSGASRVSIELIADARSVSLTITDNGVGIDASHIEVPASIRRRARLLGAGVTVTTPEGGGTCIQLKLRRSRRRQAGKVILIPWKKTVNACRKNSPHP